MSVLFTTLIKIIKPYMMHMLHWSCTQALPEIKKKHYNVFYVLELKIYIRCCLKSKVIGTGEMVIIYAKSK